MPGTLYVVATPIGNLEDVTLRALRVLREVAVIAAEDTRRTSRLLQHYSISTPTTSLHAHNEHSRIPRLVQRLRSGESIAIVSDAGTPAVSDPGARLAAAAHAAGLRVEPIPGPSAVMAALSASGFDASEFLFAGFPPAKGKARAEFFSRLATEPRLLVLYEAPHRIRDALTRLAKLLGDRPMALGRELTKLHEELVVRPISGHLASLTEGRGEYTLVIGGSEAGAPPVRQTIEPSRITAELYQMTNFGAPSRREALKALAVKYGVSTKELYRLIERGKASVE